MKTKGRRTHRRVLRLVAVGLGVVGLGLALWTAAFSLPGYEADPRSPRYVLWKAGLAPLPDQRWLSQAMGQDPGRDDLVHGLTLEEVRTRFRDVRSSEGLTQHQRLYEPYLQDEDHVWLGESWWVVIFRGGRAHELCLMKG